MKEKNCANCGYREREYPHRQKSRIYCTNFHSDKCFGFVAKEDCCPLWVEYTEGSKYFNETIYD